MSWDEKYKNSGGKRTIFKPKDFASAYAFLLEVKKYSGEATNPFFDTSEPESRMNRPTRREAVADITVFITPEHLEQGEALVLSNQLITGPFLAGDLEDSVGGVTVNRLDSKPNPKGLPSWVWRSVEGKVVDQVRAYYEKREAGYEEALSSSDKPAYL